MFRSLYFYPNFRCNSFDKSLKMNKLLHLKSNYTKLTMNKLILTIVFVFSIFISFCQSYLGWATKQVNFRSGPGTTYEIISTLQAGAQIFIVSDLPENDFYNVIDIATDKEGYLHKSFVKFGDKVDANSEGIFAITGKSTSEQPQLDIYNNTSITMTLKLDNNRYVFSPQEKKSINYSSGKCTYRASAPGVIPSVGSEFFESNGIYTWEFYIFTGIR